MRTSFSNIAYITRKSRLVAKNKGVALVITLAIVVLLCIVTVGMLTSIRLERNASSSHLERARAQFLAAQGVETVVATLATHTADKSVNWVSQPGKIFFSDPGKYNIKPEGIDLSSGTVSTGGGVALNIPKLLGGNYLINNTLSASTNAPPSMELQWIYVQEDGTESTIPSTNMTNPVVGRYAFWADDESCKINYNIASTREQAEPGRTLSNVDLTAIPELDEDAAESIRNEREANAETSQPFNSPEDARRVESAAAVLEENKFSVTHYNHDPDTTFFNEPRIVLTTNGEWAEGRPYLKILNNEKSDPGNVLNVNVDMLSDVLFGETGDIENPRAPGLVYYLSRVDWPIIENDSSFQDKYYGTYPATVKRIRLVQLAINIIDYVRSKESPSDLVEPIRGYFKSNSRTFIMGIPPAGSANLGFIGLARTPHITEMGAFFPVSGNPKFIMEVFLPKHYGLQSLDLKKLFFYAAIHVQNDPNVPQTVATKTNNQAINGSGIVCSNPTKTINAGEYVTLAQTMSFPSGGYTRPTAPIFIRALLSPAPTDQVPRYDIAPLLDNNMFFYAVDGVGTPESNINSVEVDDPRVNKHVDDWKQTIGGNTFLNPNSISALKGAKGPVPGISPPQDTDAGGVISTASFYMPPPAGKSIRYNDLNWTDDNTAGVVTSVGELGYICTGLEATAKAGVPWRSFRLQPSLDGTSKVPDWALMDLFTVPNKRGAPTKRLEEFYAPHTTSTGGRININATPLPFTDLKRDIPIKAVLFGASHDWNNHDSKLDRLSVDTIVANILSIGSSEKKLAISGNEFGLPEAFDSPGEICEIEGVSDKGEESEELVRQIASLITTRGEVFSIHSVGQALKQKPDGTYLVTAEQREKAIVERYKAEDDAIKYRTVYYQNLMP